MLQLNDFSHTEIILAESNSIKTRLTDLRHQEQNYFRRTGQHIRVDLLYLNTLQEIQELVSNLRHLMRATKRFQEDLISDNLRGKSNNIDLPEEENI